MKRLLSFIGFMSFVVVSVAFRLGIRWRNEAPASQGYYN